MDSERVVAASLPFLFPTANCLFPRAASDFKCRCFAAKFIDYKVLTTEYPEAQATLGTFSVRLRMAVPYAGAQSQYRSADRSGCLPPTGAMVTGEPISWFVDLLEPDV